MARPLRIAAIGCGDIARRRHFPDLKALGSRAELVAIQARDPQALEAFAARFGVPRWHTDADAIMADPGIDAVLVLTPPDSHFDYAEQVIQAGKHLLVRRLLDMDAIGEVTGVECGRSHRGPTHASWFYDRSRAGGGVLIDLGIYQLTAVAALFGPALSMTASCTRHFAWRTLDDGTVVTPDVEDSALLSLVLENGIAVASTASWNGCQSHHATSGLQAYYLILAWTLIATAAMYFLTQAPPGRMANACRDNFDRTQFVGYDPRRVRFLQFALSGLFAGIGGGLWLRLESRTFARVRDAVTADLRQVRA